MHQPKGGAWTVSHQAVVVHTRGMAASSFQVEAKQSVISNSFLLSLHTSSPAPTWQQKYRQHVSKSSGRELHALCLASQLGSGSQDMAQPVYCPYATTHQHHLSTMENT